MSCGWGILDWELGLHPDIFMCWINGLGQNVFWARVYVWCGCGFIHG